MDRNRMTEEEKGDVVWWLFMLIALIGMMVCLCGCGGVRYVAVETKVTDSIVMTDTVVKTSLVLYKDSTTVEATGDTATSFLSNPYAYSWACWTEGKLHHSLGIWPRNIDVPLQTMTKLRVMERQVPYPVEKELTKWERWKLDFAEILAVYGVGVTILLIFAIKKRR